jgi:hypothetical protein
MPKIVLERSFPEPVTDEMIDGMKEQAAACLEINAVTREITYISEDRLRFVCIFEAGDTESVRRAMDSAGMGYDAVWAAGTF